MNDSDLISFLNPTINSIRKSIKGIDDSYNNFWDILAELIQNSVDAINAKEDKKGKIFIDINAVEKKIRIKDDGIGIKYSEIPILLSPFSTNKENDMNSIGEKGVGLKFVIFQSNKFEMKTKSINESIVSLAIVENAKNWKNNTNEEDLPLRLKKIDENMNGTDITIYGIDNDKIFNMNFDTMKFIIRTKTAIGNVLNIFENNNNINVKLRMTDLNGVVTEEEILYKYWLPTENVKNNDKLNLKDYVTWLGEGDRSDNEKRNKLKNKIIYESGQIMHNDVRPINYWLCFVPERKIWNKISVADKLLTEEIIENDEMYAEKKLCIHQAGVFTSVKGMPTGISITPPNTGKAGYWANIFVILEDKQLRFDIGRKSINSAIQSMYQKHLKELFNNVTNKVSKYIAGDPEMVENPVWNRDNTIAEIDALPPLGNSKINFEKLPNEQEASVAAIFYELIGSNKITDLKPLISGYRKRYDLYAKYKNHFVVMEFKSHLRNIIKDFDDLVKMSDEIDYIICWDVNDIDKTELYNRGLNLETIEKSELFNDHEEHIKEATHKIIISSVSKPIYVIDLKILISTI